MKKYAVFMLAVLLATGFRHAPKPASATTSSLLPTCTCNTSFYNDCLGITLYYKFYFDCNTGIPTGVEAKDVNNNPYTVQGFFTTPTDGTFDFAIIDGCDFIHMRGSYVFGCNLSMYVFRCVPGGACLDKK